jgi:hypothetical protein
VVIGVGPGEFVEEYLQTFVVHTRQVQTEALSGRGLYRRVQIGPFVGASHDIWRTEPLGTVASVVPVDEPETRLVEGQNLQWLAAMARSAALEEVGEVCLNAWCEL